MSTVTNIRPVIAAALPDIVGYVEAFTTDRLLGWAWAPASPDMRAAIELRLGDAIVAETVADLPRADLTSNGVGDGRHAFDIQIPAAFGARAAELRVFARVGDGAAMPIGAPPAADALSDQVTKLLRGMDMLVNSQRVIHRNLQTVLTEVKDTEEPPMVAALAQMVALQTATEAQLSTVERFVVRLDEHLSKLVTDERKTPAVAKSIPTAALWALVISGTALVVSVAGLVRALGG
jgi:hypothetical protein